MEELCSDKEYPRILDMNKHAFEAAILIQVQWQVTRGCSIQNICLLKSRGSDSGFSKFILLNILITTPPKLSFC